MSSFVQPKGHENNIGYNKSASNQNDEPRAVDLPTAVGDLSHLWLSTATEVATSIAIIFSNLWSYPTKEDVPRFMSSNFSCNITSKF